jgi:hypothetical protein
VFRFECLLAHFSGPKCQCSLTILSIVFIKFFALNSREGAGRPILHFRENLSFHAKSDDSDSEELKDKIEGIDRLYGVALPKIANECLKAFCACVERKKQTPTFPLSISPSSLGDKGPNQVSVRGRKGIHDGHARRK